MKLYCKKCHVELTQDCQIGTMADYNETPEPKESSVEKGIIVVLDEDIFRTITDNKNVIVKKALVSSKGAYAINPQDVIKANILTCGVDNGCCGSDGLDGFNRRCKCGNVLGTEWSDCWTQAEYRFEPLKVELYD